MALKARKAILLAKAESTPGTDASPTGGANAILTSNLTISPMEGGTEGRNLDQPFLGAEPVIQVGTHVVVEFDVEWQSSGAAGTAPGWGVLMKGCACAETVSAGTDVTYEPSDTETPLTLHCFFDGQKHAITYAMGSWSLKGERAKIPHLHFRFLGKYVAPSATSDPTPTLTGFKSPNEVGSVYTTATLHSTTPPVNSFSVDQGNTPVFHDMVNAAKVFVSNRESKAHFQFEAPALGTKNWFTTAMDETLAAIQIVHGTAEGYIVQFDADNAQATSPKYANVDGLRMLDIDFILTRSSGNDEWLMTAK